MFRLKYVQNLNSETFLWPIGFSIHFATHADLDLLE